MNYHALLILLLVSSLAGCAKLQNLMLLEKPRFSVLTPEPTPEEIPAESATATTAAAPLMSWMDKYGMASGFTAEERQARLVTLDALTKDVITASDQQTLAMEQATLLSVPEEDMKHWLKAQEILQALGKQTLAIELENYRQWLDRELERRMRLFRTISKLRAHIATLENSRNSLEAEASQLKEQIDALTNIEQNLTVKKATQAEP